MCRSFANKVDWVNKVIINFHQHDLIELTIVTKVESSLRTSSHNLTPPVAQLPEGANR